MWTALMAAIRFRLLARPLTIARQVRVKGLRSGSVRPAPDAPSTSAEVVAHTLSVLRKRDGSLR